MHVCVRPLYTKQTDKPLVKDAIAHVLCAHALLACEHARVGSSDIGMHLPAPPSPTPLRVSQFTQMGVGNIAAQFLASGGSMYRKIDSRISG